LQLPLQQQQQQPQTLQQPTKTADTKVATSIDIAAAKLNSHCSSHSNFSSHSHSHYSSHLNSHYSSQPKQLSLQKQSQ
jgi:hypothetical protein